MRRDLPRFRPAPASSSSPSSGVHGGWFVAAGGCEGRAVVSGEADRLVQAVDDALVAWREYRLAEHSIDAHRYGQVGVKRGRAVLAMERLRAVREATNEAPALASVEAGS